VIAAVDIGIAMAYTYSRGIGADTFIALSGALYFSYDPIKKMARSKNLIKVGLASFGRIESLLNCPEMIMDLVNPTKVGTISNVSFRDMRFGCDEQTEVLRGLNAGMQRGNTYALVGSSGSGKTTITNLILRFHDVNSGQVTIDGINVRNMRLRDLCRNISIVPQSPTLINGTVLDNISWSNPSATRKEIIEAAKKAHAHDLIAIFSEGHDTGVGESGMRLSGGQKQRNALARAFLRNSPILIFDEATSALDSNSEHAVHEAVKALIVDKTTILISHRFTMMSIVDRVFVIDRGSVVEEGSPGELERQTNSMYHSLYRKQCGKA
jgi:subfamily B ATP-binding cassette protein MsbA